jgi:hypothetical protein
MNAALATLATVLWTVAYTWFFARELTRWWRGRGARRMRAEAAQAHARAAYAAWVRNIPPPRRREPILPPPARTLAPPVPAGRGVVVPFPRR